MNICPKCEKILLSDYRFCPKCGYSVYGEKTPGPENEKNIEFFKLAQSLSSAENVDQLLKKIGEVVEQILDTERSSIMLLDESGDNLYFKTATGEDILKKLKIPIGQGIAGWIAQNKKADIVNEPYNDERFSSETDKATGFTTCSIVGAPMIMENELIGVAEAINKKTGKFTEQDKENLLGFAGLAAVSIANTRLKTDQKNFFSNMLDFLVMGSEALGVPEPTDKGHAWEMARLAPQIGRELGMSEDKQQLLHHASLVHDIGFLGLENTKLVGINIEKELNREARYFLHPLIGGEMVKGIKIMKDLGPFIRAHHRYKNNQGFPDHVSPQEITPDIEIISILENYFMVKDADKVDPARFSPQIYQAFRKIIDQ